MKTYWRVFNFFVPRVVAVSFVVSGLALSFANIGAVLTCVTINVDGAR